MGILTLEKFREIRLKILQKEAKERLTEYWKNKRRVDPK